MNRNETAESVAEDVTPDLPESGGAVDVDTVARAPADPREGASAVGDRDAMADRAGAAGNAAPETASVAMHAAAPATLARPAHDDLLAGLGRRFRGATLKLDFELRSTTTRQVFRRDFVYVSQQLHALEASRRVQGLDRRLLNEALLAVERHGDEVKATLKRTTTDLLSLIALHGHADADVEFTPPARLQATIVSPYARAFVDLLRLADDTLTQLERAWLLGLLDPATKANLSAECRKAIQGFKEIARHQRHVVGARVREVNAARRTKKDEGSAQPDVLRAAAIQRTAGHAGETARSARVEDSHDGADSHPPACAPNRAGDGSAEDAEPT